MNETIQSENLNELFAALAKAQAEMEVANLNSSNPFFKSAYAGLDSIVRASRPYLCKNGLSVTQRVLSNGNPSMYLSTILGHSSGQWIESRMLINPAKPDVQSIGSYITYLRRYTYASIVGVIASEEDDDGEEAMDEERTPIGDFEVKELENLLSQFDIGERNNLLKWAQVKDLKSLPKAKYEIARKSLRMKITKKDGTNGNS